MIDASPYTVQWLDPLVVPASKHGSCTFLDARGKNYGKRVKQVVIVLAPQQSFTVLTRELVEKIGGIEEEKPDAANAYACGTFAGDEHLRTPTEAVRLYGPRFRDHHANIL